MGFIIDTERIFRFSYRFQLDLEGFKILNVRCREVSFYKFVILSRNRQLDCKGSAKIWTITVNRDLTAMCFDNGARDG